VAEKNGAGQKGDKLLKNKPEKFSPVSAARQLDNRLEETFGGWFPGLRPVQNSAPQQMA
jgi:hypothetical protein